MMKKSRLLCDVMLEYRERIFMLKPVQNEPSSVISEEYIAFLGLLGSFGRCWAVWSSESWQQYSIRSKRKESTWSNNKSSKVVSSLLAWALLLHSYLPHKNSLTDKILILFSKINKLSVNSLCGAGAGRNIFLIQ